MRLFDALYKLGVEDAIAIGNESQCEEFCDRMYRAECFGRIINDFTYSWREWKYRLTQVVYDDVMYRKQCLKFFDCISSYSTYLACVMPIAMDFYMKGLKDYAKYPNSANWVKFKDKGFTLWEKSPRKVTMDEFVRLLTGFCYDRMRIDQEAIEFRLKRLQELRDAGEISGGGRKKKDYVREFIPTGLSRTSYENFQMEIWKRTRVKSYKTRGV
jgi:hypothetical protein